MSHDPLNTNPEKQIRRVALGMFGILGLCFLGYMAYYVVFREYPLANAVRDLGIIAIAIGVFLAWLLVKFGVRWAFRKAAAVLRGPGGTGRHVEDPTATSTAPASRQVPPVRAEGVSSPAAPRNLRNTNAERLLAVTHILARELRSWMAERAGPSAVLGGLSSGIRVTSAASRDGSDIRAMMRAFIEENALTFSFGIASFAVMVRHHTWEKTAACSDASALFGAELEEVMWRGEGADAMPSPERRRELAAGVVEECLKAARFAAFTFWKPWYDDHILSGKRVANPTSRPGTDELNAWLEAPSGRGDNPLALLQRRLAESTGVELDDSGWRSRLENEFGEDTRAMIRRAVELLEAPVVDDGDTHRSMPEAPRPVSAADPAPSVDARERRPTGVEGAFASNVETLAARAKQVSASQMPVRTSFVEVCAYETQASALEFISLRKTDSEIEKALDAIPTDVLLFEAAAWFGSAIRTFVNRSTHLPDELRPELRKRLVDANARVGTVFERDGGFAGASALLARRVEEYPEHPQEAIGFFVAAITGSKGRLSPLAEIEGGPSSLNFSDGLVLPIASTAYFAQFAGRRLTAVTEYVKSIVRAADEAFPNEK